MLSDPGRTERDTLSERKPAGLIPVQRWDTRVSAET